MTQQASFKKQIRARMTKTGERYAAARTALLSSGTPPSRTAEGTPWAGQVLDGYAPISAVHGDAARLCAALAHAGVKCPGTPRALSEAEVFALMGGTGFMYFLFEYQGEPPMLTVVCRSWSMPWPLVKRVLDHAEIEHDCIETGSANKAQKAVDAALDAGHVAHLTVDGATLPWMATPPVWKGQMPRQVNVVGRTGAGYLVDDGIIREVDTTVLADARAACRKQKNRLVTFGPRVGADAEAMTRRALAATLEAYTASPKKGFASNFGLAGFEKMATMMSTSKDKKSWPKVFKSGPLFARALLRTYACAMLDYTPPAGGRAFYAQGLRSLASASGLSGLDAIAAALDESAQHFEALCDDALRLGGDAVRTAVGRAEDIEVLQLSGDDPDGVRRLREARDAALASCDVDEATRNAAYVTLAGHVAAAGAVERDMVGAVEALLGP